MTITQIKRTPHGRVAVFADGEFLLATSPDAYVRCGAGVGDEISEEQRDYLLREGAYDKAKKKALELLSRRSYTRRQLTERLEKNTCAQTARLACDRMQELGLINDADYALRYAREAAESRSFAPRRIRYELQRRGIERADIDAALESLGDRDDTAAAVALLQKKYRVVATDADARRAAALLARCGYDNDVIRTAIHAVRQWKCEE